MRMYPAYTVQMCLKLYAITFYAMLNEGYRQKFHDYQLLAQISDLPNIEQSAREAFYRQLEYASTHPGDILRQDNTGSSMADVKRVLQG